MKTAEFLEVLSQYLEETKRLRAKLKKARVSLKRANEMVDKLTQRASGFEGECKRLLTSPALDRYRELLCEKGDLLNGMRFAGTELVNELEKLDPGNEVTAKWREVAAGTHADRSF